MPGGKRKEPVVEGEAESIASDTSLGVMQNPSSTKAEMMDMFRMLLAEQKETEWEREEKRRQVLEERDREKREYREAVEEKQRKYQEEIEARQYAQQLQLIKMQQDLGAKHSTEFRVAQEQDKRRDRALFSMPSYVEGEDLEEFLLTMEKRLEAAKVPDADWSMMIDARLTGRLACLWRDIVAEDIGFQEARSKLLKTCGYTAKLAAEAFYGFRQENCSSLTASQLYAKGQQLLRRSIVPKRIDAETEFAFLRGWIPAVLPRKARIALESRTVENAETLISVLQDHLSLEGERGDGQAARFRKVTSSYERNSPYERREPTVCFKCNKPGHKAADCWQKVSGGPKSSAGVTDVVVSSAPSNTVTSKVVCFTCGVEGHKTPQCPNRGKARTKPVKMVYVTRGNEGLKRVDGSVNTVDTQILLDSGASISVVPNSMVGPSSYTGGHVEVKGLFDKKKRLPLAEVPFKIGSLEWQEEVAVAPSEVCKEVIYGLNIVSARGLQIVLFVNTGKTRVEEVNQVTTRSVAKAEKEEAIELAKEEKALSKTIPIPVVVHSNCVNEPVVVVQDVVASNETNEIADRILSEVQTLPSLVAAEEEVEAANEIDSLEEVGKDYELDLGIAMEDEQDGLGLEKDTSVLDVEERYELRKGIDKEVDMEVPIVKKGKSGREALSAEIRADPSLVKWRELADQGEDGLSWNEGLMYQAKLNHAQEVYHALVLPKQKRLKVLESAHDGMSHMGARRVKALLAQRFAWPGLGKQVIDYVKSCDLCQRCEKRKKQKVPMVERQVMAEPFESMAMDLVGPFPVGKGGCRFLLTVIDMASRWPEAMPLKSTTAHAVSVGLIEIFSRTGIPLELLSDQGPQFVGKVVTQLCRSLRVEKIQATPYHPETNGVVERFHSTLNAMLTKASNSGLDWVGQVPFALFALRAAPARETGFSPFELVLGRQVRTPLDILHQGWSERDFENLDTTEWASWLRDRLECWHEVMCKRGDQAGKKRKAYYDKKTKERSLKIGDMVLCRVPGMIKKLEEAWHGPYTVVAKLSAVDYKVQVSATKTRIWHINNMKQFHERQEQVLRISIIAEEVEKVGGVNLDGECLTFDPEEVGRLKAEFPTVFNDKPGRTDVCSLVIDTGDKPPVAMKPHRDIDMR